MVNYLENSVCKFTPLFDINYNKKINILSTCFFKMSGKGYKDFSIYVDGLKNLSETIDKLKSDFKIRLFIDNSIYNDKILFKDISNLKNIQPVLYSCPNFIINSDYHIGLFGTLVRFFPFFNFKNNDANIVVSSDIDSTNIKIFTKYLQMLKTNNKIFDKFNQIYLFKSGPLNRSLKYKFKIFYNDKLNPYIFALSFASIKRINSDVIVDFLIKLNKDEDEQIYSYHYAIEKDKKDETFDSKYKSYKKLIYGVDEYFLNDVLGKYLIDNNLCYVINMQWDIFGCLYYILETKYTKEEEHLIDLIFEYMYKKLNLKFDKEESIIEKFNRLDKIVYHSKNDKVLNKKKYQIIKLLYKVFLYFRTNNNYRFLFPEEYYKLFVDDDRYFGVYDIELIRMINCDKKNEEDILLEIKKFNSNDINALRKFYIQHKK